MKQRVTRSSARSGKKRKDDEKDSTHNAKDISNLDSFISEFLQKHVSAVQKQVQSAMEHKNVVIKEFKSCNDEVKDELMKCKSNLNQKINEIELLEKKKETFKMITLAEVEKFSKNYQHTISDLEVANEEMRDKISKQEKMLQEYEKQAAGLKSGSDDDEQKKNGKLLKKYKDLKGKIKTLDSMLSENKQQKNDLRKHIQAKDELIKLKDFQINDLDKKLNEEKNKSVIVSIFEAKIKNLEDKLKSKDDELSQMKNKLKEDEILRSSKFKMMEATAKQTEQDIDQMKSKHEEVVGQLERKNNNLEDECGKLKELQNIIKTEKVSLEKLKEGIHLQFKETFAEQDGKIKELEGRNDFFSKENEDLRVDMERFIEAYSKKDNSILMMKKSMSDKDVEISTLKLQKESNKQMFSSIIEKKNKKLAAKKLDNSIEI